MKKDLKDLMDQKRVKDLDEEEKVMLEDLAGSEEDLTGLKELFGEIDHIGGERFESRPETKRSLDSIFDNTYRDKKRVIWYNTVLVALYPTEKPLYRRPALQIAALLTIALLTVPLFNNVEVTNDQLIAKQEVPVQEEVKPTEKKDKTVVAPQVTETKSIETTAERLPVAPPSSPTEFKIIAEAAAEESVPSMVASAGAALLEDKVFDHPDGIYRGTTAEVSRSARKNLNVLDLLTPAF
jgi:hypothetical protein